MKPLTTGTPPASAIFRARAWILISTVALVWVLVRPYRGLEHDGQLYAFQALARLRPDLYANDLFVRFGSQDNFTIFSSLASRVVDWLGVEPAASIMTLASFWLLVTATALLAGALYGTATGWLAAGLLVALPGFYGGYEVFRIAENFLSARPLAQALGIFAIAALLRRRDGLSAVAITAALLVHPLMALPCAMVIGVLACPPHLRRYLVGVGVATGVAAVAIALVFPHSPLQLMAPDWFDVVHQRSIYLFVAEWPPAAWHVIALTLTTISIAATATQSLSTRALMLWSGAVGTAGVVIAAVASGPFPVELLLQGQAWRWLWLPTLLGVIALAGLLPTLWQAGGAARAAVCLLLIGWTLPWSGGLPLSASALALWSFRDPLDRTHRIYVERGLWSAGFVVLAWMLVTSAMVATNPMGLGVEPLWVERARDVAALVAPGVAAILTAWMAATGVLGNGLGSAIGALAIIGILGAVPTTWSAWQATPYADRARDFQSFRAQIPVGSDVLWLANPLSAWLLLERPSYITPSQLAGVVFSRETALEAARRAAMVDPYVDRGWMLSLDASGGETHRKLTPTILRQICGDRQLKYVVATDLLRDASAAGGGKAMGNPVYLYRCSSATAASAGAITAQ